MDALRIFCFRKIGWPSGETDRVILPVLKALENAGTRQTRLESYFMRYEDGIKFANVRSKRLQSVLNKVRSGGTGDDASKGQNGDGEELNDATVDAAQGGDASIASAKNASSRKKKRAGSGTEKSKGSSKKRT